MGFFDKIRSGRLFFGKKEPSMVVQFRLKDKKYILEEFDMEFRQDVDSNGRPDSMPYGGLITITFSDVPDENINTWMMDSFARYEGEFRFLNNTGMIREGALLQILFRNASCVSYQKIMNPTGAGLLTTLVISPQAIRIGNEEFERKEK